MSANAALKNRIYGILNKLDVAVWIKLCFKRNLNFVFFMQRWGKRPVNPVSRYD